MLTIHISGYEDNCIQNVTGYFNRKKKKEWFNNPNVKRVIKNIDNTLAIKDEYLESPVFGGMSPERLSTGCKAVILLEVLQEPNVYATKCGNNCVPDILEIAKRKDITITLHHPMDFPEEGFEAYIVETDKWIHSGKEFILEYYKVNGQLGGLQM